MPSADQQLPEPAAPLQDCSSPPVGTSVKKSRRKESFSHEEWQQYLPKRRAKAQEYRNCPGAQEKRQVYAQLYNSRPEVTARRHSAKAKFQRQQYDDRYQEKEKDQALARHPILCGEEWHHGHHPFELTTRRTCPGRRDAAPEHGRLLATKLA